MYDGFISDSRIAWKGPRRPLVFRRVELRTSCSSIRNGTITSRLLILRLHLFESAIHVAEESSNHR